MLPAEVCRVAGHPVEVRCLSSEVCRADCAVEVSVSLLRYAVSLVIL